MCLCRDHHSGPLPADSFVKLLLQNSLRVR
ncbi:mCG141946 [Mus musculus]|nr:mCG141946 [Mus musculus]